MCIRDRPYFDSLQRAIAKIIVHTDLNNERFFATDRDIPADQIRHGYIIITSDRGLAGAYNHNVCKVAETELKKSDKDLSLIHIWSPPLRPIPPPFSTLPPTPAPPSASTSWTRARMCSSSMTI